MTDEQWLSAFPEFDPVIFSLGPVSLHWYGLMYLVGFIFAMCLLVVAPAVLAAAGPKTKWKTCCTRASSACSSVAVLGMCCSITSRYS
nr:prolipoprotein diacylglyceryl transferase family protein [Enterobacter sp. T2]